TMEPSTSSTTKPKPTSQLQSQYEHTIVQVPSSRHSRHSRSLSIERPHNGRPISKIICSPGMKYVGTWSNDDKSAVLWSIITGQQHLKYENEILRTSITEPNTLSAVSDNMHVVIKTNSYHLNFEMFEVMTKQKPPLGFPNTRNIIDRSEFTIKGDFVVVSSFPSYRAYVFTPTAPPDSNIEWNLTSMLELSYFSDSFITIQGNLILFNDKTFQLTNWFIKTMELKTNCPIDWNYVPVLVEVTEDEELLGICAKTYTEDDNPGTSRIYIYSTMNGMNLATYDYDASISIDKIYFIAHEIGERLLVISHDTENNVKMDLFDPYTLKNPVNAENLFEIGALIQNPYTIKFSQLIGLIDGTISIYRRFIRDKWIDYLRQQLNDYNRLFTLSDRKVMHEMIKKATNIENYGLSRNDIDRIEQEETYNGRLLKWELDCRVQKLFILKAFHFNHEGNEWQLVQGKSQRNIFPNFHSEIQDRPQYIIQCRILEDDDLFMITTFGVLIWTVIPDKGIRLLYYWGNEDLYYQELTYTKLYYSDPFVKRILPPSEFDIIIKFKELTFGPEGSQDVSYFFREFIEDYITNKFSIIFYGSIIMKSFIKMDADLMIEKLCESCFEFNFKSNDDSNDISTSNIQSLSIIVQIFPELIQKHPNYLAGFLSRTAFVIPFIDQSSKVREKPSIFHSSHLYHHGTYNYLSKTSLINIFISRIHERWKHFQYIQYKNRFQDNQKFSIYSFIETFIIIPYQNWYDYYNSENNITIKLLLPLPKFVSYPESYNTWKELWKPLPSNFVRSIDGELYKYWNGEALLNFKWNTYGRKYYMAIWLFYAILLGCFAVAATTPHAKSLTSMLQLCYQFAEFIW
ncbi:3887_t:CDS:2, partial [Dentiscutata erythropus]